MKYFILTGVIIIYLFSFAALFAQESNSMQDGFADPDGDGITGFTVTGYDSGISNIIVDSSEVLILRPNVETLIFSKPLGWTLSGIFWQYDNTGFVATDGAYVTRATDVDDVTRYLSNADSTVYLITDFIGNKVFAREVGKTNVPFLPPNGNESGPVDADFFIESDVQYVLVTYRSTDKIVKFDYDLQKEVWSYGGFGLLASPSDAEKIEGTDQILVADTGNRRVIIVDNSGNVVWEYTESNGSFSPVDVEYINDVTLGNQILITDQGGHRVILVSQADNSITWSFGTGSEGNSMNGLRLPADADWVEGTGNILIADKGNNRIIEVNYLNDSHFYQWPNATNDVEDVDPTPTGKFLVSQKEMESDKELRLPTLLAFSPPADREGPLASEEIIIRQPNGQERQVDFRDIYLYAQNTPYTSIQYQFRSAPLNVRINDDDPWYGPDGINTKYTYENPSPVQLYSGHKPHTSAQFGAHLSTDSLRITPKIDSAAVVYNYYNVVQDDFPAIIIRPDTVIGPPLDRPVAVAWDTLTLFWKKIEFQDLSDLDDLLFNLTILNAQDPSQVLLDLHMQGVTNRPQKIILSNVNGLRGAKQITFRLELVTRNSGITPQLDGWRFSWREIEIGPPSIQFADSSGLPKAFYTATTYQPTTSDTIFVDSAFVRISNVIEPVDTINVDILAPRTTDSEPHMLIYDAENLIYRSAEGTAIELVTDTAFVPVPGDGMLHLLDRDSLNVEFVSAQRPGEILSDSIMVVQGTIGLVTIENTLRDSITIAALGDRLHLRIRNELDRSLDPVLQDSIRAVLHNDMTSDYEDVILYEQESSSGIYHSGLFMTSSEDGVLLSGNSNSPPNDGVLFSRLNDRISARYPDNFKKAPTFRFITIPDSGIVIESYKDLIIEVAPNPYRQSIPSSFDMRVRSDLGDVMLQKLEVYNLSGERVMEMDGNSLVFSENSSNTINQKRWGHIRNWWDLRSKSGHESSSGTYWVKLQAQVTPQDTNIPQNLTAMVKFVVIR